MNNLETQHLVLRFHLYRPATGLPVGELVFKDGEPLSTTWSACKFFRLLGYGVTAGFYFKENGMLYETEHIYLPSSTIPIILE